MKRKELTKEYVLGNKRLLTLTTLAGQADEGLPNITLLTVGWAVKDPTDDVSPKDLGRVISKGRAENKPLVEVFINNGKISDSFLTELSDTVAKEFDERFYSFVPLSKNGKDGKKKNEENLRPKRTLKETANEKV
jgi:hypothetical protein